MVKQNYILILFLLLFNYNNAQHLISYVSLNKKTALIGEPVQMTVSVYSSTWFTQGINIGNLQIENALTVYFRSVSNSKTFSGKNYSGVDFIYNVFPTKAGQLNIPELNFTVESPPPNGYKGIEHQIKTKTVSLQVKDVPIGFNPQYWMVSSSLNISENWSTNNRKIKVGDVIQRTIKRTAGNTLGEFIPSVNWDSIKGVSIYEKRPFVKTNKTKTYVSAEREDKVNYLFEKEGTVIIPKIEFTYWNHYKQRAFVKSMDSVVFQVEPNPDLEMVASIKKELEEEVIEESEPDEALTILGLTIKQFIIYSVFAIIILLIIYKILKWLIPKIKLHHENYLKSEYFAFKKLIKAIKNNDKHFYNYINKWIVKLDLDEKTLNYFAENYGTNGLQQFVSNDLRNAFNLNYHFPPKLHDDFKKSRNIYLENLKHQNIRQKNDNSKWLNPIKEY